MARSRLARGHRSGFEADFSHRGSLLCQCDRPVFRCHTAACLGEGRAAHALPAKASHILFPLDGFPENDALLVPKTEDGRVIFAVPWNGRLLVGTTDTGYTPGEEMVVTREEIEYLLRQLNPYLSSPLRADQVVSGYAGVRPLVAAQGVKDTKKLIRDDEVEFDAESGLISILGGKWTTHRLMGEETIDKVQEYLGGPARRSQTPEHPLSGSVGLPLGLLGDAG